MRTVCSTVGPGVSGDLPVLEIIELPPTAPWAGIRYFPQTSGSPRALPRSPLPPFRLPWFPAHLPAEGSSPFFALCPARAQCSGSPDSAVGRLRWRSGLWRALPYRHRNRRGQSACGLVLSDSPLARKEHKLDSPCLGPTLGPSCSETIPTF